MKILYPIIFALVLLLSQGCADNETSARKLYNEAMTLQQNGNIEQAMTIYKKIIAEYPETETAVDINKQLSSVMSITNALNKSTEIYKSEIKKADAKLKSIQQQEIAVTLDSFKLDNGRYPSTEEGLQALVIAPDYLKNWKGPYFDAEKSGFLNEFDYQSEGNGRRYTLQIK